MSYQGSVSPASSLERLLERLIRTVVGWARAADGCRATCMADHMATQTTTSSFWKAACIAKYARTATSCSRLGWASTGRASFPKGHFASCSSSCSRRRSSRQVPRVARPGLCVMIGAIASRATSLRALRADPTGAVVGKMPANGVWCGGGGNFTIFMYRQHNPTPWKRCTRGRSEKHDLVHKFGWLFAAHPLPKKWLAANFCLSDHGICVQLRARRPLACWRGAFGRVPYMDRCGTQTTEGYSLTQW